MAEETLVSQLHYESQLRKAVIDNLFLYSPNLCFSFYNPTLILSSLSYNLL